MSSAAIVNNNDNAAACCGSTKRQPVNLKSRLRPYTPPSWTHQDNNTRGLSLSGVVPTHRISLAALPTPVMEFQLPEQPEDVAVSIKADDLTGSLELAGNKLRKLEFLLADSIANDVNKIYTCGGSQSNCMRATAAACRRIGMPVELFMRRDYHNNSSVETASGATATAAAAAAAASSSSTTNNGNLFLNTLLAPTIHEYSAAEWASMNERNPDWLYERATATYHESAGAERVSVIPIGGSNAMGTWGYIEAIRELDEKQGVLQETDTIICPTGSGGTAAGLGIGSYLAGGPRCVSYGIGDDPQFFYDRIDTLAAQLFGNTASGSGNGKKAAPRRLPRAHELVSIADASGNGYGENTVQELQFISRMAREYGMIFDSCYNGKALYGFWKDLTSSSTSAKEDNNNTHKSMSYSGQRVLYVHTGGMPSMFDHTQTLIACDPTA